MSFIKKIMVISIMLVMSFALSACGLFNKDSGTKADSADVSYEETSADTNADSTGEEEQVPTVTRELYLIDKDGYVVPQTIQLPQNDSAAKQVLEYLVVDGPVSEILPSGFRAVLPAGTEMSVDVQNNTAIVDFSNEVKNYDAADEQKILQAVTWSLTQFENISTVKLRINGFELAEMPVAKTPVGDGLTRASGINFETGDVVDITNSQAVTLYFLAQSSEGDTYYVPVTRRVNNSAENIIETVVNELVKGPSITSSLLTDFDPDAKVLEVKEENGIVSLNFNEYILGNSEQNIISTNVLDSLVLSLTEQQGVESVAITVNGSADIINDNGEKISEAVSRPEMINVEK